MKAFFTGVLRIATGLLVVLVVIALGWWGISSLTSYSENRRNAPLEIPRELPASTLVNDLGELSLKTMWRDSRLHYQFELNHGKFTKQKRAWILILLDADDFEVFKHTLGEVVNIVDKNSVDVIALRANGSTYMAADEYRRVKSWTVQWRD